ncbi:MAG: succinyldiaminopimelate transaminase [Candidatus Obscuribacterales bacterium]|jgi:N-succinyldiaminopimelate aminotransferase|nr:succinyldiaminopimelate transaminase [Candidatus Obscuribacterales bacterium]
MNPGLKALQPYPFEKLSILFQDAAPNSAKKNIAWSIGEPKHPAPAFVAEIIQKEIAGLGNYPLTAGMPELREAIRDWLTNRFKLQEGSVDRDRNIVPVNGTREALFAACQFLIDPSARSIVSMPNPFYQIYEGAAFLAGAEPFYCNVNSSTLLPDFDSIEESVWQRTSLLYVCSPGNPTGAVCGVDQLQKLIELSDKFSFVIASDECYSEIYPDENEAPAGLLEAAAKMGRHDFKNCLVFHSLSKRSSLPGMRSGFVAGDAELIAKFKHYRTYHGCAMAPPFQKASIAAWRDEEHVRLNREMYRQKFQLVGKIVGDLLDLKQPAGSFYYWPDVGMDDQLFAKELYRLQNMIVLPGSYLSREVNGSNPGKNRVRMALVAPIEECEEGAQRLVEFINQRKEF